MAEQLGKFVMEKKSEHTFKIDGDKLKRLKRLLISEYQMNLDEVHSYGWDIIEIDDKSIIGEDAESLVAAMQLVCAEDFYIARTDYLLTKPVVDCLHLKCNKDEIANFQNPYTYEMSLSDCLFFTLPLSFAILRPGKVATTYIAGSPVFLSAFTNIKLD